mgnify:CR=1 FL=1
MSRYLKYGGQVVAYGAFALLIGFFSRAPVYQHLPDGMATIKVSLRHAGQLLGECRQRTPEEMANLPPNMRAPMVCPRERSPLLLELDLGGERVFSELLPPSGLHGDGRAAIYRRLTVPAGHTEIEVRMKNDVRSSSFHFESRYAGVIEPAQVLVIDFNEQAGRFTFL